MRFAMRVVSSAVRADAVRVCIPAGAPENPRGSWGLLHFPALFFDRRMASRSPHRHHDHARCQPIADASVWKRPLRQGTLRGGNARLSCRPVCATTTHRALTGGSRQSAVQPSDDRHCGCVHVQARLPTAALPIAFRSRSGTGESLCTTS